MMSRSNAPGKSDRGEAATPIATEPPTQSASVKTRFEDGFGSVSAVAGVLAEVASGATRGQLVRERDAEYQALSEFQQIDHRFQRACFKQKTGLEMSDKVSDFDEQHDSLTKSLLATARQKGWLITNRSGVPQAQPSRFGLIKVSLVRDWFAEGRAPLHAKYAQALDDALRGDAEMAQPNVTRLLTPPDAANQLVQRAPSDKPTLKSGEIAQAFSFLPTLKNALANMKKHRWLASACVTRGDAPIPATWCPLLVAEAIRQKKGHESELRHAFANSPLLRPWRDAWQEAIRERNAFGR